MMFRPTFTVSWLIMNNPQIQMWAILSLIFTVFLIFTFIYAFKQKKKLKVPSAPKKKPEPLPSKFTKSKTDYERVQTGLSKTKSFLQGAMDKLFANSEGSKFYDEVEEAFLSADVGIDFSERVIGNLKKELGLKIPQKEELKTALTKSIHSLMPEDGNFKIKNKPHVIMIVGVNGAGKTTTIAKLCEKFIKENKKVLVGAADTFRAAATAQLKTWIERVGAEGVFQAEGADPSAVAFDSVQAAQSRGIDVCIIDTAGRLHTKSNLMDELKKMKRVITKALPLAPHDIWLVLDGTQGQNALQQAKEFNAALNLTGLIITKLDGSAKGGALLAISSELKLPVLFIGVGEATEDLVPFKKQVFVETLF